MAPRVACVSVVLAFIAALTYAQDRTPAAETRLQDQVFSGPQAGETLAPFTVRGVFAAEAGKLRDFVTEAAGGPILLVFVHEANRPSIGLTRTLTNYTLSRANDGLRTGIVWLDADMTEAENRLKRMRHALTPAAPIGISIDGEEGPGSYGLNRKVTLTILVGNEGRVTANFALVQPSIQADVPKILSEIVRQIGGEVPKLEDLPRARQMMRARAARGADAGLRRLLRPLIRKDATPDQVESAAAAIEQHLEEHEEARQVVGRIASNIVTANRLANYGTPPAQEYLRKWAEQYGPAQHRGVDRHGANE